MSEGSEKQHKENLFWKEVFLAVLPVSVDSQGWESGDKKLIDLPSRVELAGDFATEALRLAREKERI